MNSEKSPRLRSRARCSEPPRLERPSQPEGQRLSVRPEPIGGVGPDELAQQVHEVVLGQIAGLQMLASERGLDQFLEVLDWRLLAEKRTFHEPSSGAARHGHAFAARPFIAGRSIP